MLLGNFVKCVMGKITLRKNLHRTVDVDANWRITTQEIHKFVRTRLEMAERPSRLPTQLIPKSFVMTIIQSVEMAVLQIIGRSLVTFVPSRRLEVFQSVPKNNKSR